MNRTKLWTKDFLIDSITNFIVYLVYYLPMVTIAVYAMDHFHASASEAGFAAGIFIIGGLLARTMTGRLIARTGQKKTLYAGLSFFLAATLLYFYADSLPLLMIIRFLHGVGWGISATATGTIVAGIIPQERIGEGTSYYSMSATLASAIGPFLGILIIHKGDFHIILSMSVVLLLLSLISVLFLQVQEIKLSQEQIEEMKGWTFSHFFEPGAIPISVVSIFLCMGISSILSFLSSYTRAVNLVEAGSFFFIVYAASIVVSRPFTGWWFDRRGENFVLYPSFISFALGLVILGQARQGGVLLLAAVFIGLGYGTFMSCAQALAVKLSPIHRKGLATSTFFSFADGGAGIGPLLLGLLIPVTGYRGLYGCAAVLVFACIFLYHLVHGRKAGSRKEARVDP